jgi:alpha-galactosidase
MELLDLYAMMRDALNKTGRPILFSMCEWGLYNPWEWGMKTANMWRIGPDHRMIIYI